VQSTGVLNGVGIGAVNGPGTGGGTVMAPGTGHACENAGDDGCTIAISTSTARVADRSISTPKR